MGTVGGESSRQAREFAFNCGDLRQALEPFHVLVFVRMHERGHRVRRND